MKYDHMSSYLVCFLLLATCLSGCSKFIAVDAPYTSTASEQVFGNNASAEAALTAIYMQLSSSEVEPGNSVNSIIVDGSLYADELATAITDDVLPNALYTNKLTAVTGANREWSDTYNKIYEANAALEGLSASSTLSSSVKQQLLGEAYFLRGFFYFYLVNMFGDVPLAITTDYKVNGLLSRSSQDQVYTQIVADLNTAESLLSEEYMGGDAQTVTIERVRPSKAAAETMLARVYLYQKEYLQAETYATKVLDRSATYGLTSLDSVFLKNSQEAIWQLSSVQTDYQDNTVEGRKFIVSATSNTSGPSYQVTTQLLNNFEETDQRRDQWIGYAFGGTGYWYFPYKYKIGSDLVPTSEYSMVIRLAEVYLIRAEARAMLNKTSGAQEDINAIRHRAGLANTTAATQDALVNALLHERNVELFTEWGHRFFDLKRLGQLDAVLGAEKPTYWNTEDQYFPIPQTERNRDPNLTQNDGYK